jgi:hypothetical protein
VAQNVLEDIVIDVLEKLILVNVKIVENSSLQNLKDIIKNCIVVKNVWMIIP